MDHSDAGARPRRFPVGDRLLRYARLDIGRISPLADVLEQIAVAEQAPVSVFDAEQIGLLVRMGWSRSTGPPSRSPPHWFSRGRSDG